MIETFNKQSPFLLQDKRADRWAIPYNYDCLNSRVENIIIRNKDIIEKRTILDLGCHFGTFSYAALTYGARQVCGVDSEKALIGQANELFTGHQVDKNTYSFYADDVIRYLASVNENAFDTILCLGIFYYINDPVHFLRLLKKTAGCIILDTFTAYYGAVVAKDGIKIAQHTSEETFDLPMILMPVTQSQKQDYRLQSSFIKKHGKKQLSLLTLPTIPALEYMFDLVGLNYTRLTWDNYTVNNYSWKDFVSIGVKKTSHWADVYHTKLRVTYILQG